MTASDGNVNMRASRVINFFLLTAGVLIVARIGSCAFVSHNRSNAFESVQPGASELVVVNLFGVQPSVREKAGVLFPRYASVPCVVPCAERLWFENRLSLDTEAWSVELDKGGLVIKKSRWNSP